MFSEGVSEERKEYGRIGQYVFVILYDLNFANFMDIRQVRPVSQVEDQQPAQL